jgi:hypothetical protein
MESITFDDLPYDPPAYEQCRETTTGTESILVFNNSAPSAFASSVSTKAYVMLRYSEASDFGELSRAAFLNDRCQILRNTSG